MMNLNTELLAKVRDRIAAEPGRHNQESWMHRPTYDPIEYGGPVAGRKVADTECGTTFCIAGWVCVLATDEEFQKVGEAGITGWEETASELLFGADKPTDGVMAQLFVSRALELANRYRVILGLGEFESYPDLLSHVIHGRTDPLTLYPTGSERNTWILDVANHQTTKSFEEWKNA